MTDYNAARTTMVDCQVRPSDVTKFPIIEALLSIPREEFVPANLKPVAYIGEHLDLGSGRSLLDARTFGKLLDAVNVQPSELVLDLGCGLGYSSAVIAHMAEAVIAVEENADMAEEATGLLSGNGVDNVAVVAAPLAQGAPIHGPYDVIILEGSAEQVPDSIFTQLKDGGRIAAIRTEGAMGQCQIGHKNGTKIDWRPAFSAAAPLLSGFEKSPAFCFG
ncbi:MAG: protein-L-isoaspartate O-methyltransferase [Rhodobacteraceae bacterium]|nr:protein-L-isoaspartate O-methyltransferase [Paracoccaceae bacterium]